MSSVIRNLLDELSWEGNARRYRDGGQGIENVVTAEVFQALDMLPRRQFLQQVLQGIGSTANSEGFEVTVLPGNIDAPKIGVNVQPDVVLKSDSDCILVEAKGFRHGRFQLEQLYREAVAADHHRGERRATLLAVVTESPPVRVAGHGRLTLEEALGLGWEQVKQRQPDAPDPQHIVVTTTWISWQTIADRIDQAAQAFGNDDSSVTSAVGRLADTARDAIAWHASY